MKKYSRGLQVTATIVTMTVIILDSRTAQQGAKEGISLCLQSVIPSLFPFIFLSLMLTSRMYGQQISFLKPVGTLCAIPSGAESLLLIAFLGGYPVGAQAVHNAWLAGSLDTNTAKRLLGFCSNAGPSFIFGLLAGVFANKAAPLCLWLVHIASAVTVGAILPSEQVFANRIKHTAPVSATTALQRSVQIMGAVCGWIVIVRIVLTYITKYLLYAASPMVSVVIGGCLELTNGCISLPMVSDEPTRFIIASFILALGGLCVYLQTRAVTGELGTGIYFRGKILQALISVLYAAIMLPLLYPVKLFSWIVLSLGLLTLFIIPILKVKKSCSNLIKAVV